MNINYELYKVFYLAAREMSFSKSAELLFVTQSSISQSIKSLETQIDTPLFFRNGKRISLTPSGTLLFEHLSIAFNEIDKAENLIDSYRTLEIGELRIGASDTICKHYLLKVFERFHTMYPKVKLLIDNQPSPKTQSGVLSGTLDLGFINHHQTEVFQKLNTLPFYTLDEIFFTSSRFPELSTGFHTLKELGNYPFVSLKSHTSTRRYLEDIFKSRDIAFEPEIELISIDLIVDLVAIGLGVGFADRKVIEDYGDKSLVEIPIKLELPKREISIISNARAPLSNAAKAFLDIAQKIKEESSL
jgi:DNA-binding transcriptional LysR family regulator